MKAPQSPRLDERRAEQFAAELQERAQAWIPQWGLTDSEGDFGKALLEIAARFDSEVAERLDGAGEKMRRGFLDWLAVRGQAARPARMPVVFKLADTAREGVLASAPVRLQADAAGTAVVFETEDDVRLVPGQLDLVVGVDADQDAFFRPPPGLSDLEPLESLPTQWQVKSFAAAGVSHFQLDPEAGLLPGTIIEAGDQQYQIVKADKDLVTIDRPLVNALDGGVVLTKVTKFSPYDGRTYNHQQHALYLGDSDLLNVEAPATIEVVGASTLREGFVWQYWGKVDGNDEEKWQPLALEDQAQANDAIVLKKPKGAITPREIGGLKSRWLRGATPKLEATALPFAVDALKLRVNCQDDNGPCFPPETAGSEPLPPGPVAEAMANTTPLVLSEPFHPLGREPRQFDAFYLGSSEAFSKKGATAKVCLEMSDATCLSYAVLRNASPEPVLAGVGKDKALHIFKMNPVNGAMKAFRGPLRPPFPADAGVPGEQTTVVSLNPKCRPVIWAGPAGVNDFFIAVAAGRSIWIWHENATDAKQSGWKLHSTVPALPDPTAEVQDIIVLKSAPDRPGAVLSGGRFWIFSDPIWIQPPHPQPPGVPLRDYASLVSVYDTSEALTDSMVAVGLDNRAYRVEIDGTESLVGTIGPLASLSDIRPAAVDNPLRVVAVAANPSGTGDELVALMAMSPPVVIPLGDGATATGAEVTFTTFGSFIFQLNFFFVGSRSSNGRYSVATWIPTFQPATVTLFFESQLPDDSGPLNSTPLQIGSFLVVPGSRGDAFVAPYSLVDLQAFDKLVVESVILPDSVPFAINDFLSVMPMGPNPQRMEWTVTTAAPVRGREALYVVDPTLGQYVTDDPGGPEFLGYRASGDETGVIQNSTEFIPDSPDPAIVPGQILRIEADNAPGTIAFCEVDSHIAGTVTVIATTPLPDNGGTLSYWKPTPSVARVAPAIEFSAADGNWDELIRNYPNFYFRFPIGAEPEPSPQQAITFSIGANPTAVALTRRWTNNPPPLNATTNFVVDGVIGAWQHQLADTSSNPALSWEYWNGKGWWSLEILQDGTARLAVTGALKFRVPQDIAESDWAGKSNFWIRARLVGGDYGHEEVTVVSKPGPNAGETLQTVVRSTENIKAPLVLDMRLSYSICNEVLPTFLLAEDNGTVRDQSDANSTAGAIVEAFVPLAMALGRLSTGAVVAPESPGDCPPECACDKHATSAAATPKAAAPTSAATSLRSKRETGRSVFLGLTATPSEAPVNVLLLVDEQNHTEFAPMTIEALVADRFVPIVADDATRALGESGLLSMAFAVPPTPSELFGETRTWLRLKPKASPAGKWLPTLRGAYLNAAWASATETLTRELLGSSNGEPHLTVRLARPPVLYNTLELRVKEPLGEEERKALLKKDKESVLSVEGLPGDWVLWKQVVDPDDEPASARVYSLDENSGEIRFGDGRHGKIPPIGRDAIVAFRYCRTEPDPTGGDKVPGNSITARTTLNLVSPVETVEAVTAADQAAGGAPPESADRVLRFGFARLRHRDRAVTAYDIEDLALQSSPDIVQAHAFVRRGYVRLIVVMRGKNPQPSAPQIRELRNLLLAAAPVSLSAPGALRIEGPVIRRLRIDLELQVETLSHAGALADFVKQQLATFFDTAVGGTDKSGWALGLIPNEGDIALALIDAPYLESIKDVKLLEITDDGQVLPVLETLKGNELVMLADDPVRIQFETAEVMV